MSDTVNPNFSPHQIITEALRVQLLVQSLLKDVRTTMPVQVIAVHPGTGSPPSIGTVDVQPLVLSVGTDGILRSIVPNGGAVYGVPFSRIQSGGTAIVIDPAVNDIGLASACDRDISSVIASGGKPSGPGSKRTHDVSDLVYLYSIISAVAITQYILGNANGLTLFSPNTITIQGGQINLIGPVAQTGGDMTAETKLTVPRVDATIDVTVPLGSVNDHVHGGVESGGDSTGPMTG